jgi:hypothetical protein
MSNEPLRQKIEALEANPDRGAKDTMNLAQLRARYTIGEFEAKHPGVAAGLGALGGARLGLTKGPAYVAAVRSVPGKARDIVGGLKDVFAKGAA